MSHWIIKSVSQIGTVVSGATPRTGVEEYWGGSITWITPNDLSKLSSPYLLQSERNISDKGLDSCSAQLVPAGNLVLSSRAPIGYFAIPQVDFTTNQGCKSIVFEVNQHPLFHYYNFNFLINRFKEKGEGTTFAEISKKAIEKLEFQIPDDFGEQVGIAKVINTIDQAIYQTSQLISKYEHVKTGLMQDLLAKGIDENGNIRSEKTHEFKDSPLGRIPKEWNIGKFGDIATLISKKHIPSNNNILPCLNLENLVEAKGVINGFSQSNENLSTKSSFEKGDILFGKLRPYLRKYWMAEFNGVCTTEILVFRNNEISIGDFIFQIVQSNRFINHSIAQSFGTKMPRTDWKIISEFQIPIVPKEEQNNICIYLQAIATLELSLNKELDKNIRLKSALMQDLLTGKVRVDVLIKQAAELV